MKLCILANSKVLISNIDSSFFKFDLKVLGTLYKAFYKSIRHFGVKSQSFFILCTILNFGKFESVDLKYFN